MSGNIQKTPLTSTLNAFATRKAGEAINLLGKSLPCSVVKIPVPGVPIVTVKFEIQDPTFKTLPNVTVPVLGSEYVRLPLQAPNGDQPGTLGEVIAIDAYMGGISGLGGGVADLSQRGNLSTLGFLPVGNKNWQAAKDPNALTLYGVDKTIIQDTIKNASAVVVQTNGVVILADNSTSTFTITANGAAISAANGASTINMSNSAITLTCGGHTLTINNAGISLDGILFATHVHGGVQGGTGDTGPPL